MCVARELERDRKFATTPSPTLFCSKSIQAQVKKENMDSV
jgi:hypothetical protein